VHVTASCGAQFVMTLEVLSVAPSVT